MQKIGLEVKWQSTKEEKEEQTVLFQTSSHESE